MKILCRCFSRFLFAHRCHLVFIDQTCAGSGRNHLLFTVDSSGFYISTCLCFGRVHFRVREPVDCGHYICFGFRLTAFHIEKDNQPVSEDIEFIYRVSSKLITRFKKTAFVIWQEFLIINDSRRRPQWCLLFISY